VFLSCTLAGDDFSCPSSDLPGSDHGRRVGSAPSDVSRSQRSSWILVVGVAQQINALPSAGASSGSGAYRTLPSMSPHSHVWHTPLRQDHLTGTAQASAKSSRLEKRSSQGTTRLLRVNTTFGPAPALPSGACGNLCSPSTTPGENALPAPNTSVWTRPSATPHSLSAELSASFSPVGPQI